MAVQAMAVKHAYEPTAFDTSEFPLNDVGVLVSLLHVRDEALPALARIALNQARLAHVLHHGMAMCDFIFSCSCLLASNHWRFLHRCSSHLHLLSSIGS